MKIVRIELWCTLLSEERDALIEALQHRLRFGDIISRRGLMAELLKKLEGLKVEDKDYR